MEKETKLLIGVITLSAAGFFIPLFFGKIWLALFIALVVAVIFLGRLISWSESKFESKWAFRTVYGLVALIVLFNAISFAHDYGLRDYQKDILLEIRKMIDSGITQADVREKFMYVLGQHHQNERETIVGTYRELMPEHLGDGGIYLSDYDLQMAEVSSDTDHIENDHLSYFYEIDEEADEVRVIVVADITEGQDSGYKNYDGQSGRTEMMFTLNKEGVSYEVLN